MRLKTLSAALVLTLGFQSLALADDDLMSIFEEKSQVSDGKVNDSQEIQKLKKSVGALTAEQNIFFQFLSQKDYEKSLFQWTQAFEGTSFQQSATGQALYSLLVYKNGLRVTAIEKLMAIRNPKAIHATVVDMWREHLTEATPLWGIAQTTWTAEWTEVLGSTMEVAIRSQQVLINEDISTMKALIQKTAPDSKERSLIEWQLVLNLSLKDEAGKAAQILNHLMKVPRNPIGQDLMDLTAGRLLYQNGYLDAALKYYEKIPKSSDHWFIAQEEKAWAFMRKGEPQNAIATSKTLVQRSFKNLSGPEAFLVYAFAQLKVCDYPQVMETLKVFPVQFKDYALNLSQITKDPNQVPVENLLKRMQTSTVKVTSLGVDAAKVPRSAVGDETLKRLALAQHAFELEAVKAGELYGHSLTFGQLQGKFETVKSKIEERARIAKAASFSRVKDLAQVELTEIQQVLEKLHIVEAEMIQQIATSDKLAKLTENTELQKKVGSTGSKAKFAMTFPAENEVWFDELSNYKVDIQKGCQAVQK